MLEQREYIIVDRLSSQLCHMQFQRPPPELARTAVEVGEAATMIVIS
jgi:hypothetical protein